MYGFRDRPRIVKEVYLRDKGVLERTISDGDVYHLYIEGIKIVKVEKVKNSNNFLKNQSTNTD